MGETAARFTLGHRRWIAPDGSAPAGLPSGLDDPALLERLSRAMLATGAFDRKAVALQRTGRLGTNAYSLGQEAVAVGLAAAVAVAAEEIGLPLAGARLAVQGFGAVGRHAARCLLERGAVLVAASDRSGAIADPRGLDLAALLALKAAGRPLAEHAGAERLRPEAILGVPCDIWIPAARPDVVDGGNAARLQARIVAEGANIPLTGEAEAALHARGVLVLPDFIANAGGVICAATEYAGGTEAEARALIAEKVAGNTRAVLEESRRAGSPPREAAMMLAQRRLQAAMGLRRHR